jgi:hypothetical protein
MRPISEGRPGRGGAESTDRASAPPDPPRPPWAGRAVQRPRPCRSHRVGQPSPASLCAVLSVDRASPRRDAVAQINSCRDPAAQIASEAGGPIRDADDRRTPRQQVARDTWRDRPCGCSRRGARTARSLRRPALSTSSATRPARSPARALASSARRGERLGADRGYRRGYRRREDHDRHIRVRDDDIPASGRFGASRGLGGFGAG